MSNLYEHLIRSFGTKVKENAQDFISPQDLLDLATTLFYQNDVLYKVHQDLNRKPI